MKNVQMILNKEAQLVKELEAVKIQKEQMAINALADATEILKALNCEYLLESNTTIERPVNITIKKGKVTQLVKEVEVTKEIEVIKEVVKEVKDNTEIERLTNENKSLKAEIEKLKKTIATMQRNAAKKESKSVVDTINEAPNVEEVEFEIDFNDAGYLEYLAQQEEGVVEEEQEKTQEETVNEPVVEIAPKFVKESPARFKNNPKARIYQTERCYLIASPTTKEITWMSNETLTTEYKEAVEAMLVKDYKFLTNRQELSPVVINRDNAYMARAAAKEGFQKFSGKDLLCGYVNIDNKFYLYSYVAGAAKPYVDSLDKKIINAEKTKPSQAIVDKVMYVITDMYKEYKALTASIVEEEKVKEQQAADKFNANQEAMRKQREIDEAIIAAAGLNINKSNKKEGDNKQNKPKVLSASLAALAGEF